MSFPSLSFWGAQTLVPSYIIGLGLIFNPSFASLLFFPAHELLGVPRLTLSQDGWLAIGFLLLAIGTMYLLPYKYMKKDTVVFYKLSAATKLQVVVIGLFLYLVGKASDVIMTLVIADAILATGTIISLSHATKRKWWQVL